MSNSISPKFTFRSDGLEKDTFHVVRFTGNEGLSSLYRFSVFLISKKNDVDLGAVLQHPAVFTIKRDDGDLPFNGVVASFEQLHQAGGYVFYRAELVPRLWRTTFTHHNQIFLNKNLQDLLDEVLKEGGLRQGLNYEFKLQGSYSPKEYVCQYDESHFNFLSRWMERSGLYYYFEQDDQGEKMVITDTHIAHSPMAEGTFLTYATSSGLDHPHREEVIRNFMLKQQPLPQKVLLKDYNYRKPSLEMKAEAEVSANGMGEIYLYGEHFQTVAEGEQLAKIRAEEFRCREKLFSGVSSIPYVRTGYIFTLKDHYRPDFNNRYLTTQVTHEGSQERFLTTGLGLHLSKGGDRLEYRNSFTCIPADTQFRPERTAEKPKFHGSMNARIDAAGSGKYAELDDQGRYKVILPMDVSGRSGGKATTWMRMAQPYGGADHGMHFPLHKNTEVLLTCIDGDPDRPIIQGAVPNPETPSQVTDVSQTQCRITTAGQNRIHMEDKEGSERILMQTPTANTWVRMGAPNDPPSGTDDGETDTGNGGDGVNAHSDGRGKFTFKKGADFIFGGGDGKDKTEWDWTARKHVYGNSYAFTLGASESLTVAENLKIFLGLQESVTAAPLSLTVKMGTEATWAPFFKCLRGVTKNLSGSVQKLRGDIISMEESHTAMTERISLLRNQTSKLAGETVSLAGQVERVEGEVQEVAGAQQFVCDELTNVLGEENAAVGERISAIAEYVETVFEKSTVSATSSKIATETSTIAGLINNI